MTFLPAICVVSEFVGLMLMVTIKLDTMNGKKPNLPASAPRLVLHLMVWPVLLLAIWFVLHKAGL